MNAADLVAKKRDRQELAGDEIAFLVTGFLQGSVSEGQMGALLMAVFLNGMTAQESADLTLAMANSGDRLDLSGIPGTKVDKHSTGGVGDKTTLVVAPLVAALGVPVPKMSGRALGHTGGTIDKLEAIPGLTTDLSPDRFCRQVGEIGLAIAAQTARMAPADKLIYALRDATGTVESIPLIASSVMSKKLAVGADAIVLDVKAGLGAFMREVEHACQLARAMVDIGARQGRRVVALVTSMEQPLGAAVGDAVELAEAVATLSGRGPADLVELCQALAAHMLLLGGVARDLEDGRSRAREGMHSGIGLAKLREMVTAQGGSAGALDDPEVLVQGTERIPIELAEDGVIVGIDPRRIGLALRDLKLAVGEHKHACGLLLARKVGGVVGRREPVAFLVAPPAAKRVAAEAVNRIRASYRVGREAPPVPELVAATIAS